MISPLPLPFPSHLANDHSPHTPPNTDPLLGPTDQLHTPLGGVEEVHQGSTLSYLQGAFPVPDLPFQLHLAQSHGSALASDALLIKSCNQDLIHSLAHTTP